MLLLTPRGLVSSLRSFFVRSFTPLVANAHPAISQAPIIVVPSVALLLRFPSRLPLHSRFTSSNHIVASDPTQPPINSQPQLTMPTRHHHADHLQSAFVSPHQCLFSSLIHRSSCSIDLCSSPSLNFSACPSTLIS